MKLIAAVFLIVISSFTAFSQTYEVGGFLGGANYIGDVGKTSYISPNTLVAGGIFKWNRGPRHSFRGTILFAGIQGNDADSDEPRRQDRGYSFTNQIKEISIGLEYNFWDFTMYNQKPQGTPYLYTGLTYFRYNALFKRSGGDEIREYDKAGSIAIPMVIGYKAYLGSKIVLGFEIGVRYTFTDDLDGSNPVNGLKDEPALQFGNIDSNDWYVFSGLTATFTFGRKPCYCNF